MPNLGIVVDKKYRNAPYNKTFVHFSYLFYNHTNLHIYALGRMVTVTEETALLLVLGPGGLNDFTGIHEILSTKEVDPSIKPG